MDMWKIGGSWVGTIAVGVLSLGVAFVLFRFRMTLGKFLGEVRAELMKCSWPWDPSETGPIVPTLTWGFERLNASFAINSVLLVLRFPISTRAGLEFRRQSPRSGFNRDRAHDRV